MHTLSRIAQALDAPIPSGALPSMALRGVAGLNDAGPDELSYLSSRKWLKQLPRSRAGVIIAPRSFKIPAETRAIILAVDNAELAMATALRLFAPPVPAPPAGVDPAARVAQTASLGESAAIGPFAVVGQRAVIGARSVIHPGVYIGDDVRIGDDCVILPNVVIRERIEIGHRVIIHAGAVIGSDGFGYHWDGTQHVKVPQIGTVVIEDDVEIGSCACVDRAKFAQTRIGRGTKIDNLVQVGHNVIIGPHCIVTGQVGLAGSVTLGAGVVLGGQSAVRDHVKLGDGAMVAACSAVAADVGPQQTVSGLPALHHRQSLREQAALRRLPDLVVQVRKLQDEVDRLLAAGR